MQPINQFESRMRLVFGLAFAVLFGTVAVSVFVINRLNENSDWVSHTHEVIAEVNATHIHFGNARVGTKNYLLTRQVRHLAPRVSAFQSIEEGLANLRSLTYDNTRQTSQISEATAALKVYQNLTAGIITEVDATHEASYAKFAAWTDKTERAGREVATCFMNMRQEEERLLLVRDKVARSFVNQAYSIMPCMLAVQLVIIIYIYYGVLHHVPNRPA